jgi:hypothetical protein
VRHSEEHPGRSAIFSSLLQAFLQPAQVVHVVEQVIPALVGEPIEIRYSLNGGDTIFELASVILANGYRALTSAYRILGYV